jgi:hypothetical protein
VADAVVAAVMRPTAMMAMAAPGLMMMLFIGVPAFKYHFGDRGDGGRPCGVAIGAGSGIR